MPKSSVFNHQAAIGQHVDGERHHPDQLGQVAAHDRPAAAEHQVDQEQGSNSI